MANISRIEGLLNSQLSGQVAETTRSQPGNPPDSSAREIQEPRSPRGVDETPAGQEFIREQSDSLNPENLREMIERIQETISENSPQPHAVGFREDPETRDMIIEIRTPEGEVIKTFPPEKVLNLHRRLDDLSGMVIDRMT